MSLGFGLSSGNALKSNCYGYKRLIWHIGFLFHGGQNCFVFRGETIFVFALLCFVKLNCREFMNNRKSTKDRGINSGTKLLRRRDGWGVTRLPPLVAGLCELGLVHPGRCSNACRGLICFLIVGWWISSRPLGQDDISYRDIQGW